MNRIFFMVLLLTLFSGCEDENLYNIGKEYTAVVSAGDYIGILHSDENLFSIKYNIFDEGKSMSNLMLFEGSKIFVYKDIIEDSYFLSEIIMEDEMGEKTIIFSMKDVLDYIYLSKIINGILFFNFRRSPFHFYRYDLKKKVYYEPLDFKIDSGYIFNMWVVGKDSYLLNITDSVYRIVSKKLQSVLYKNNTVEELDYYITSYDQNSGNIIAYDDAGVFLGNLNSSKRIKIDIGNDYKEYEFYYSFFLDEKTFILCYVKKINDIIANLLFSSTNEYKIHFYKYFFVRIDNNDVMKIKPIKSIHRMWRLLHVYVYQGNG